MLKHTADLVKYTEKFFAEIFENGEIYLPISEEDKQLLLMESNHFSPLGSDKPSPVVPVCSKSFLPYLRAIFPKQIYQEVHISQFFWQYLEMFSDDGLVVGLNWDQRGFGQEFQPVEIFNKIQNKLEELGDLFFESLNNDEFVYLSHTNADNYIFQRSSYSSVDNQKIPLTVVPVWSRQCVDMQEQFNMDNDAHSEKISCSEFRSKFLPRAAERGILLGVNWLACDFGNEIDSGILLNG